MRPSAAVASALVLVAAVPCLAAEDHNKLAADLAKLTLSQEQWDKTMTAMQEQMAQAMAARGPKASPEEVALLMEEIRKLVPYGEMCDLMAGLLAKYYTDDELKALTGFYKSPLGQKALRIMPDVMRDAMGAMQSKLGTEIPAIIKRLKAKKSAAKP